MFDVHIVNRRNGFETRLNYNVTDYLCFSSGLCRNEDHHCHVPTIFLLYEN